VRVPLLQSILDEKPTLLTFQRDEGKRVGGINKGRVEGEKEVKEKNC